MEHPPQAQLPQGRKPGRGQAAAALCRVRPWGGGPGGQVFRPGRRQPLWVCPSLGREGLVQGHSLRGVPGQARQAGARPSGGAGCTWHWCRRSCRPLVGFPQRTRPAPEEEGAAGPSLGLRGYRAASRRGGSPTVGEAAGVVLWGWALGKKAFRQEAPGDQQGAGPGPGGPALGLR